MISQTLSSKSEGINSFLTHEELSFLKNEKKINQKELFSSQKKGSLIITWMLDFFKFIDKYF